VGAGRWNDVSGPTLHFAFWTMGVAAGVVAAALVLHVRRALALSTVLALGIAVGGLLLGANLQFRLEIFPVREALDIHRDTLLQGPMRIPLGLLVGAVLAGFWCILVGAPWRETGDALAVAASVMIPIGRVGCLVNGCCMGTVCGRWVGRWWCPRYPSGTQAYERQFRDGLISLSDQVSLPAHPLPVYFALTSLLTLGILIWLLRRQAPPGAPLAVFCILRPLSKLLLEPLRAMPRQGDLMIAIPLGVLLVTFGVLAVHFVRRSLRAERAATSRIATLALVAGMAWLPAALRADGPPPDVNPQAALWTRLLGRYARDPLGNYAELRRVAGRARSELPPPVALALADGYLRMRHPGAAARVLKGVLARGVGEPWAGWADLDLGWVFLSKNDLGSAAIQFQRLAAERGPASALAQLGVALIEAGDGEYGAGERSFDALATDDGADERLRDAARLGAAYTKYWAGEFAEAVEAFTRVSVDGPFADDARYGSAISSWHAGAREESLAALRRLAQYRDSDRPPAARGAALSDRLLHLEWGALLRAGFARYRQAPVGPPQIVAASLLDGDGVALARAALHRLSPNHIERPALEVAAPETISATNAAPRDPLPDSCPAEIPRVSARRAAGAPAGGAGTEVSSWRWRVAVVAGGAVVLLWWIVATKRRMSARQGVTVLAPEVGSASGRSPWSAGS